MSILPFSAPTLKTCRKCGEAKPLVEFHDRPRPGRKAARCKACVNAQTRAYAKKTQRWKSQAHRDWKSKRREHLYAAHRETRRATTAKYRARLRAAVVALYGGCCQCCAESLPSMLALDHINGDGKRERAAYDSLVFYRLLLKLGAPRPDLQLLCHNCNWSRARNGGACEHALTRANLIQRGRP